MGVFLESLARLAAIPDADLAREHSWRSGTSDVRYAVLFRSLEEEQAAATEAHATWFPSEASRILNLAQSAFGDLRGLLVGTPAELLDQVPAEGEWSPRQTLEHAIGTERSYRRNVQYALERADDAPTRLPPELRPKLDPADTAGDTTAILERFALRREETDGMLAGLAEMHLERPTNWSGFEVDVRFRLHRFASHIVEHTIQCETTLERLGVRAGDARRVVRRISLERGRHERVSRATTLASLDGAHAARAASLR